MALQIIGLPGSGGHVADVDAQSNLKVNLPTTWEGFTAATGPGFATMLCEADPGTVTGTRYLIPPEADDDFRLRVGEDNLVFFESWTGTTINGNAWKLVASTMQASAPGAYARLNSNNVTASGNVARLETLRTFASYQSFPLYVEFDMQVSAKAIAGNVWEIGLFLSSGTAAPTDGAFVRMNAAGEFRLVANFGGAETESGPIDISAFVINTNYACLISISTHELELWIDDVLQARVEIPSATPGFTQSPALPFAARNMNAAAVLTAVQVSIGPITISYGGMDNAPDFRDRATLSEQGAYQTQSGGAAAQTANWTNNAAPTVLTLNTGATPGSNTTAGYTTFGGKYAFNAIAGSDTADYLIFGFQVPAEAANAMNRNLLIRGVRISAASVGATVATTPTVLEWGIAVGSNAQSLATADVATTTSVLKGPRRKPLGSQGFVVGALAGTVAPPVAAEFPNSALLAEPGSWVQIFVRIPYGTATAGQIIRGTVDIDGQYE